jgi:phosphotransferase system HPr-like phosphotransfer protein
MTLEAPEGSTVQIRAEGPGAAEAMQEVDRLIKSPAADEE